MGQTAGDQGLNNHIAFSFCFVCSAVVLTDYQSFMYVILLGILFLAALAPDVVVAVVVVAADGDGGAAAAFFIVILAVAVVTATVARC